MKPPSKKLTVSMVVLTRDRPELLGECLASIVRQTVQPAEVIIVDDSQKKKKETRQMIDSFRQKLPINTIQSPLRSIASARDTGARHARGDIVVYLDDDLVASPTYVARMVTHFQRDPTVSAVIGKIINKYPNNIFASTQYAYYDKGLREYFTESRTPQLVKYGRMLDCEVMGIRREAIRRLGFSIDRPNRYRNDDVELGLQLVAEGKKVLFDPQISAQATPRTSLWSLLVVAFWNGYSDAYTKYNLRSNIHEHPTPISKLQWLAEELHRQEKFPKLSFLTVLILFRVTEQVGRWSYGLFSSI